MPGGYGLRFALEAGFLILLAAASAVADLRTAVIVAIVAGGWLIVCLVEWLAWRAGPVPLQPAFPAAPAPAAEEPSAAPDYADILVPEGEQPTRIANASEPPTTV